MFERRYAGNILPHKAERRNSKNEETSDTLKMKKLLAITLLFGMVCAMSVASAGETYWTVGYPNLFLRSTPSTEYPYLERMPYGSEVIMISDGTDWALVYYNGQYGYVFGSFRRH